MGTRGRGDAETRRASGRRAILPTRVTDWRGEIRAGSGASRLADGSLGDVKHARYCYIVLWKVDSGDGGDFADFCTTKLRQV